MNHGLRTISGKIYGHTTVNTRIFLTVHEASLTSRSQTSGGDVDSPVVVLYASISVLNLMRAATGSQCKDIKRGVTWALLGSSKTSPAASF